MVRHRNRYRGGGASATRELNEQKTPEEAMAATLPRLNGAFALAILFAGRHDLMIGARRGSPLAVGYGDGEMYLGSDALALAPLTQRICYLEEDDWAVVTTKGAVIRDRSGQVVERPVRRTAMSGALIGKGNYRHFMEKEIWEQPGVLKDTLQAYVNPLNRTVALPDLPFDWRALPKLTVVGCGTAYLAGMVGKYWFSGLPDCRSRLISPPSSATAKVRCRKEGPACSSRSPAKRSIPWRP